MHASPEKKAQLEVELDRGTVRIEHVQERSFRARRDGSREITYKLSREPLSPASGVDAYGADFGESIEPHALARHGDQHPLTANPNVLPEFNRARTERPRMCASTSASMSGTSLASSPTIGTGPAWAGILARII
jgi:hypothetical protein